MSHGWILKAQRQIASLLQRDEQTSSLVDPALEAIQATLKELLMNTSDDIDEGTSLGRSSGGSSKGTVRTNASTTSGKFNKDNEINHSHSSKNNSSHNNDNSGIDQHTSSSSSQQRRVSSHSHYDWNENENKIIENTENDPNHNDDDDDEEDLDIPLSDSPSLSDSPNSYWLEAPMKKKLPLTSGLMRLQTSPLALSLSKPVDIRELKPKQFFIPKTPIESKPRSRCAAYLPPIKDGNKVNNNFNKNDNNQHQHQHDDSRSPSKTSIQHRPSPKSRTKLQIIIKKDISNHSDIQPSHDREAPETELKRLAESLFYDTSTGSDQNSLNELSTENVFRDNLIKMMDRVREASVSSPI